MPTCTGPHPDPDRQLPRGPIRLGLCTGHYAQQRQGKPLAPLRDYSRNGKCSFPDCGRPINSQRLCGEHARQQRQGRTLTPLRTERAHRTMVGGYVKVYDPKHPNAHKNGWVLEHVKVMSEHLGRPLWPDENVHHKNGQRDDNRLSNLELWTRSQPSGQRAEDKVVFAVEILRRYRPDLLKEPR
jgi:hypothetical protein